MCHGVRVVSSPFGISNCWKKNHKKTAGELNRSFIVPLASMYSGEDFLENRGGLCTPPRISNPGTSEKYTHKSPLPG